MPRIPWILGCAKGRGLCGGTHGKLVHIGLAQNYRSRPAQVQHRLRRKGRHKIVQNFGGTGGQQTLCTEIVLDGYRNPCQRPCQLSRVNFLLHLLRLLKGPFLVNGHIAVIGFFLFPYLAKGRLHPFFYRYFLIFDRRSKFNGCHIYNFHPCSSLRACHSHKML